MTGVFVSYRREDSRGVAGRLYDRLVQRFGDSGVFMDVDSIEAGLDFVEAIEAAVGSCRVLLAVIGPTWTSVADGRGRRLDDPDDLVVIEIGAALSRRVRVIPVLVEGASMPHSDELPPALRALARRNALRLNHDNFSRDTEGLVDVINRLLTAPVERPAAAPPVPASSSNDRWQANLHRYQTTGARTLEIHLANGDEEHTILVKWTAWRDSIAIDDRVIATSLGKGLVGRRHTFVLQGESGDVAGAILISEDPATKDEFFQYYLLDRLTIDGQEIPGIWEN